MDETLNEIQSKTEVNLSVVSNFLGSLQYLVPVILDTYTYKRPWPAKQARDLLFNKTNCLRDLDGLRHFLLRLGLWHGDSQNAVLHLGRNLVADHIVRQCVVLLVV